MTSPNARQLLIERLHRQLKAVPHIHAVWLEGADAEGRADEYSDLDLWLDVDSGQQEAVFTVVREVVATFGPMDVEDVYVHPHPQIQQRFYRSVGLPPFLFVDVCIQMHGREFVFGPADAFLALFDWDGVLKRGAPPTVQIKSEAEALISRRWRWILVEKEVRRGHPLEALASYHAEVLEPLTELLRLRYAPHKTGYGLKHIYDDLPAEASHELEALYALTQPNELPSGMERAGRWMDELASALT